MLGLLCAGITLGSGLPIAGADGSRAVVRPRTAQLDPKLFSQVASGVVLIRGFSCTGSAKITGTGFLVGASVVMTARHVVDPGGAEASLACKIKVRLNGRWVTATRTTWWYRSADPTGRATDLATLKLAQAAPADDYVFDFRNASPPVGTNLSMIGHPLGNEISLTQGKLFAKVHRHSTPLLAIQLLGAEGASGSPIVDNRAHVVGVLQLGLGGQDVLGQRTSGVVEGIDLASWWGSGHQVARTLCRAYPKGEIRGCATNAPPVAPPPTTTTAATPTTTTTPVLPPSGAWPPAGFVLWSGPGSYRAGTVAWQYASCTRIYSTSSSCWGVNVVAQGGCKDGAFANVNLYDASGALVDTGIDEIPSLPPGQVGFEHGDTFKPGATTVRVSKIECFNL